MKRLLTLTAVVLLAACQPTPVQPAATPTATPAPVVGVGTKPADPNAPVISGTSAISIDFNILTPKELSIAAGTTVTWTNKSGYPKRLKGSGTSLAVGTSTATSFDSGTINNGGTFAFKFDAAGTYSYQDLIAPGMNGTIYVK